MSGSIRPSLLTKHLVFLFVGLIGTLGFFAFWSLQALSQSTQEILRERLVLAETLAFHIDEHLREAISHLEDIAALPSISAAGTSPAVQGAVLHEILSNSPDSTRAFLLLDASGRVVLTKPDSFNLTGTTLSNYTFVNDAIVKGKPGVSGIMRFEAVAEPTVLIAVPIRQEGTIAGALLVALDPSKPSTAGFISLTRLGETGYAQVVDDNGLLIGTTRPNAFPAEIDHGSRFIKLIKSGQSIVATCHRCHETNLGLQRSSKDIIAFAPLTAAPWGVAIRQSEDEAFALVYDLRQKMILVGLISLLVLAYLAFAITKGIITPIRTLTKAAERIANGDFHGVIPAVGTNEIKVLAHSLEAMRHGLNASREAMELRNVELQARTEELQHKTAELSALFDASKALASTLDLDALYQTIVAKATDLIRHADASVLFLFNRQSGVLTPAASIGLDPEFISQMSLKPDEGIVGEVFTSAQSRLLDAGSIAAAEERLTTHNRYLLNRAKAALGAAQQAIYVPIMAKDTVMGTFALYNFLSPDQFTATDVQALRALADQAAMVLDNARLYEEVQRKEEQRRQLLDKVILAQEEERKRIARELHDEIGQALTALIMALGTAEEEMPDELSELKQRLGAVRDLTSATLEEIRRLMLDLRPTLLDDLGLIPAISWYAEKTLARAGLELKLDAEGLKRRLPSTIETALFRVVQEAITNIVKYAAASRVRIWLKFSDSTVTASVEDDGRGFDLRRPQCNGNGLSGLGLLGMEERMRLLGGSFRIDSSPGSGTRLTFEIPLREGRYADEQDPCASS